MKSKIEIERAKNEIYKTIFDSAYQAILIIDTENNFQIIDVNKQTLDMFDYTFEEITSLTIFDLSANPELTKIRLDSGVTETVLSWYKKKNGDKFPIRGTISKIDFNGRFLAIVIMQDITHEKEKEEAAIRSEERYKAIVEDQIELICRFTPDGILTFVNKSYCDSFKKSEDDLIGKPFIELIEVSDRELVETSFKSITKEKPYNHYDHKVILSNGEVRWQHWSDRAIFRNDGTVKEYQSIGFDITDRKKLEENVMKSKLRYRAILDNLQEGFYQTDINGNICFVSQSALEILGYNNRNEVLGTPVRNVFLTPDERGVFIQRLKDAGGKFYEQELELVNKNGETVAISLNCQLVYDDNGNINGTQGTFRDITDSKVYLSEIKKLYQVVEGSQNALVVFEIDGTITYSNKALLKIAKSPEWVTIEGHAIGKKIKTFLSFDAPDTIAMVHEIAEKTGKWFGSAYLFCACSQQERVPIDLMISRITDEHKIYYVASFYDTTERRALENKIKEQSRMYEELQKDMSILVEKMDEFNNLKFKKITHLEEAFARSVQDFQHDKGGILLNAPT
jgi:PAS domain S-box-containing protein